MHIYIYALHALEWKGQEVVWEKQAEGEKKEKYKMGVRDSHNSTEDTVQLMHRPVPLRPYH